MNLPRSLPVTHLPAQAIAQYRDDGWCLLGRIIDDATIAAIRSEEQRFRGFEMEYDQDVPGAKTLFRSQVHPFSAIVREVVTNGPHLSMIQDLLGPDLVFTYTQFVTKFPDGDSRRSDFPWHQDHGYGGVPTADQTTVWVALDDVDERNGCVYVMPGSHRQGLLPHTKVREDSWHMEVPVAGDGIPALLKAGEAVAFTGLTLHRSLLNHTDRPRRGFFMQYATPQTRRLDGTPLWQQRYAQVVRGQLPPLVKPPRVG